MRIWEVLKLENKGQLYWIEGDKTDDLYEVKVNDELGVAVLVNIETNVSLESKEFLYEILGMRFIRYDGDDE